MAHLFRLCGRGQGTTKRQNDIRQSHGVKGRGGGTEGAIKLSVRSGAVRTGAEQGRDRQAYQLTLKPKEITNLSGGAKAVGFGCLAAGIAHMAIVTRGFRAKATALKFEPSQDLK